MFHFEMKGSGFCISGVCTINQGLNLRNIHLLNYYHVGFASPSHTDKKNIGYQTLRSIALKSVFLVIEQNGSQVTKCK